MPAINFARLKQQITIQDVLELIGWEPIRRNGAEWRGPCPFHVSQSRNPEMSRSFAVNVLKHCFHCKNSECGVHGNAFDLWIQHERYGDEVHLAAQHLCAEIGLDVPWIQLGNKRQTKPIHRRGIA